MELNREEAIRARRIALKKLEKRDFSGAQKVALQAQRLYPELENLSQLLSEVYCAAEERINSGVVEPVKPYDVTVVFWTICPHCQKRFVYYQRNFLVTCDNCGKNFFAFKFSEQALPLRFLSAAANNNSQISQEMALCQHVVPDQLVQHSKLHATGGSMDSTHSDEPITWDGISDSYGEGSSETRSNIVQCSAGNETHSSSPSADKGAAGSMMLVSLNPEIVANQNVCGEDASTVLNSSGSCNFQRLCKRKQDDCTDRSHSRDACNDKRQSKDNSLADVSSMKDKMHNDNFPSADSQATKHLPSTVDSQDEGNATHEGRQQKYNKEATDTANQKDVNPVITYDYECSDSIRSRDSCNNKRQRREDNSFADANPSDGKMYNDNVAGTDNQATEHVPSTVESRYEVNATQEGSQQKYMEGTDIADQLHGNPVITFECADISCSMDSCHNMKQRKENSPADANSSDDKMYNDNVAGTENKVEEVLRTVDSQDDTTHEGSSQQNYKMERTGIANQKHDNPVIYECPDFFNFGKLRDINSIAINQIWAVYDDHDFMPRVYAQINHVDPSNLKVQLTWLEHNIMNGPDSRWTGEKLPAACGNFCLGETFVLQDPSMYLSHRVSWTKGKNRNSFEIHPEKGEIWALYKESSCLQSSGTDNHQTFNYDVVEVSSVSMNVGFVVTPLVRIEDFVSLFAEVKDKPRILIQSSELFRFSHSIPCYRTNGTEKVGVGGLLELDTAALPCDMGTTFPSITLDSYVDLNKKRVTESFGVTYPDSEFHNFDEDRSCEKFEHGQIWALYSTDTFPNIYGCINKVEKEPFNVRLTWLKVFPQGVNKHWLENDIPVSCGKFGMWNLTSEHYETCAFSHLVLTRCQIDTAHQVTIVPKVGEVWAIYKNWAPDWIPSSKDCPAQYAIGEIKMCTETSTLFAFLTKVHGYISVFKPDVQKGALEVRMNENLRFSHRIPSFRLTTENGGKLRGFYELDPAAVPETLLDE